MKDINGNKQKAFLKLGKENAKGRPGSMSDRLIHLNETWGIEERKR